MGVDSIVGRLGSAMHTYRAGEIIRAACASCRCGLVDSGEGEAMTTAWRIACGQHFDNKDGKIFSTSGPHQTRKASGRSHGQNTDHYSLRVEKNGADKKKRRLLRGRGRLRAESACGLWLFD